MTQPKQIKATIKESGNKKFSYVGLQEDSVAEVVCNNAEKYGLLKIVYLNKDKQAESRFIYVKSGELGKLTPQSFIYIISYDNKYGNLMKPWTTVADLKAMYPEVWFFIPTQSVSILDNEEAKIQ